MLYNPEHGAGRDVHPSKNRQTSYDAECVIFSLNSEMQKGVGDGNGVGMKLFRRFYLIRVPVIALTKVEGG